MYCLHNLGQFNWYPAFFMQSARLELANEFPNSKPVRRDCLGETSGGNYGGGNNYNNNYTPPQKPQKNYTKITILLLIFFFPLGLYFMWSKTSWNKIVKIIISVFIGIYCLFFAVVLMADDSSSLPASSSGITEIYCYEDTIRLDMADSLQDHKTIDYHFRTANASDDLLKSDFVIVFADESIADAEVNYITDYANEVQITVKALNAGTTTMHVETIDGTIKSDEITVEVIGQKPAYSQERDSTTETRSETTTETTTKETTTRETTTEETTKDTMLMCHKVTHKNLIDSHPAIP